MIVYIMEFAQYGGEIVYAFGLDIGGWSLPGGFDLLWWLRKFG